MSPSLSVVTNNEPTPSRPETVAERVRNRQAEAKQLARDHIHAFTAAMTEVEHMAAEIAEGGDAYPAGVRDLARRFVEDCEARVQTVEAIVGRG